LTGFIEAFDKHWNIALRDVDEVFCRKRKIKSLPLQQPLVDHTQMSLRNLKK
jgi:small nuclear ribonucleoprotein (snRNP)-like protein